MKWKQLLKKIHSAKPVRALRSYPSVQLAAAGIGFIAVVLLLWTLFIPYDPHKKEMRPASSLDVRSVAFLDALSALTNTPVRYGERPIILNNGEEFLPDLYAELAAASSSITFTNYIWSKGEMSDRIFDEFIAAAKRGVMVKVLLDAHGTSLDTDKVRQLREAGGEIVEYRKFTFTSLFRVNSRNHRRAVVIDGRIGYLGGAAIDDTWYGNGREHGRWRDIMFRVEGDMAKNLQNAFVDIWFETTGEVLAGDAYFPEAEIGNIPYLHIVATPTRVSTPIRELYLLTLKSAREEIYIANPYVLLDIESRKALLEAARSGVDVKILTGTAEGPVQRVADVHYGEMLDAGIKIYEYKTLMHVKTMVVDGEWSIIGSANLDNRSRAINTENNMGIQDRAFAQALIDSFKRDIEFADEVTQEDWKTRRLRLPISYILFLFAKQY